MARDIALNAVKNNSKKHGESDDEYISRCWLEGFDKALEDSKGLAIIDKDGEAVLLEY
ncbi:MAG: hypothetical protein ACK53L_01455 [Pirellulaceae bacterium]|jgi:hypothetical protein